MASRRRATTLGIRMFDRLMPSGQSRFQQRAVAAQQRKEAAAARAAELGNNLAHPVHRPREAAARLADARAAAKAAEKMALEELARAVAAHEKDAEGHERTAELAETSAEPNRAAAHRRAARQARAAAYSARRAGEALAARANGDHTSFRDVVRSLNH